MRGDIIDSIISTRVRLARNVKGVPFPTKMNAAQAKKVSDAVTTALGSGYVRYSVRDLGEADAGALVEKHLVSKELVSSCRYGAVIVGDDETESVMLNEEDHIRAQVILRGLNLEEAYRRVDALDDRIGESAAFAYSEKLGYLTACPTNLGTGIRASVMMFLPALTVTDTLSKSVGALGMFNVTLRGVYGEGSEALGSVYQVSNQRTLGLSEREVLSLVSSATAHLLEAEERAREFLIATRETPLKDEIYRAYGLAAHAYKLTNQELIRACALIKLGAYYGFMNLKSVNKIDDLVTAMQPYSLVAAADRPLTTAEDRDVYRAKSVRSALREIVEPMEI